MTDNTYLSNLMNPLMAWTDLSMRALDMTLASAQNMSDGVDRLTRANASPSSEETASTAAQPSDFVTSATDSSLAAAAKLQTTTFELMTRSWQQWLSTLTSMMSLGAGRGMSENMMTQMTQNPWLNAWRQSMDKAAEVVGTPGGSSSSGHRRSPARRESQSELSMEHAFAKPESKARRSRSRAGAKTRSTRSRG